MVITDVRATETVAPTVVDYRCGTDLGHGRIAIRPYECLLQQHNSLCCGLLLYPQGGEHISRVPRPTKPGFEG